MTTVHTSPPPNALRHRLPDERNGITHKFTIFSPEFGETDGYVTVNLYENGDPGEIFVSFSKEGTPHRAMIDAWATMVSMALQSGITLESIVRKFKFWKFEPAGMTENQIIPMCQSPLDYICKWMEWKFLEEKGEDEEENPLTGSIEPEPVKEDPSESVDKNEKTD